MTTAINPPEAPQTTPARAQAADVLQTAGVLQALAASCTTPQEILNSHHLVLPLGYAHKDITDLVMRAQPVPPRKQGTVLLKSLQSLRTYLDDQALAGAAYVYADPDKRTITAVFNDQRSYQPGWRDHRAVFTAEYTPEFDRWLKNNAVAKSQTEFAEFIEDNFADITEPAAQQLLDVASTIQATTGINFASAKRLQDGQVQLQYTETIDARAGANGALQIPKDFSLGLRIFKNGGGYKLRARLKYRLNSGTVKFWYELDRPERAVEDAFAGYVTELSSSGYAVLLGVA
jgi:uncharacterized protein YfdQ (DUF2303 family)